MFWMEEGEVVADEMNALPMIKRCAYACTYVSEE